MSQKPKAKSQKGKINDGSSNLKNETENLIEETITIEQDNDLYEHFKVTVDQGQSLLRIDKFLVNRIQNATRNKIQSATKAGNILVNDKAAKSNYKVKPGDVISIVMSTPPRDTEILPENIPINIVYEDDDIIIVNKEAGMVVHPAYGNFTGTLVNALAYHYENLPVRPDNLSIAGLVHRIDKNTSGILVIAKNEITQARMAKQFFDHIIDRTYVALVWGDFEDDQGTITGNIGRHPKNRKLMTVFPNGEEGKDAITHYKVIERFRYVTLIECRLETGRTHQIRAHMKYLKHPLFNDMEYGGNEILKGTTFTKYKQFVQNCFNLIPGQALHAKSLGFIHPTTGKHIFFDSDLPENMKTMVEKWRKYTKTMDNG